jgi:hypothetical protein
MTSEVWRSVGCRNQGGVIKMMKNEDERGSGTAYVLLRPERLVVAQNKCGKLFVFSKQSCWHKELCSWWWEK